jgi:hypothetical protein
LDEREPEGFFDEKAKPLHKVILGMLFEVTNDSLMPEVIRSPGHTSLKLFSILELQLGELFDYFRREPTPREAVCRWASENMDYLNQFVPRSYPRALQDDGEGALLVYVIAILGGALLLVLWTWGMMYRRREKRAIVNVQIEFLRLLLAGSTMVALAAIVVGAPVTNGTCVTAICLINIGYTLEFVPLIVKVTAITRMMSAA